MWWIVGGAALVAVIVFVCWIVWEAVNAPLFNDEDMFEDLLKEDEDSEESEAN